MAFDKDAIIASLKEASISDLNDLVKAIEEESTFLLLLQLLLPVLPVAKLLLRTASLLN